MRGFPIIKDESNKRKEKQEMSNLFSYQRCTSFTYKEYFIRFYNENVLHLKKKDETKHIHKHLANINS